VSTTRDGIGIFVVFRLATSVVGTAGTSIGIVAVNVAAIFMAGTIRNG
jgi:hypothetical protein